MYAGEGTKVSNFVAVQRARDEARKKNRPPAGIIDAQAEFKLYGGYKAKQRKNKCETCFQVKSLNGTCSCPE
jgi:hypothetical protein